ncbi:MAG TPA: hypothetical protein PKD85_19545 [Saprospiraceae bacterium]|nr:hypothetical protein [Saprospiraceae bacterium]
MKNLLFTILYVGFGYIGSVDLYSNKIVFASKDNTVWFEIEKSRNDLIVHSNKFRKKQVFFNKGQNLYENNLRARIKVVNDDVIEYDDPNHRLRFRLYREETVQVGSNSSPRKIEMNTTQLEGTWYNEALNKKLAVLSTRDGFKIKFTGTVHWVEFMYDRERDLFIDDLYLYFIKRS